MERALRRAELENRPDDTPDVIAKRLEIYHAETEPIVEHYRATGKLVPLHAERSIDEVWAEVSAGSLEHLGRARVIIRKSDAEIETMARAGRSSPSTLALLEEHMQPGCHDGRARRARRGVHPLARRRADVQGLQGLSGRDLPLAERRWSSTGSRAPASSPTATSSRSTSA